MTAIRAHRAGAQPRAATRTTELRTVFLGPDLPLAACKGLAPLFDHVIPDENPQNRDERHRTAIRVCRRCSERADCLTARLTNPGLGEGVWGGQEFVKASRVCGCGTPIESSNPRKKHCTDLCRAMNNRTRTPPRTRRCPCGTTFTTNKGKKLYCTDRCQKNAENQRRRARRPIAA